MVAAAGFFDLAGYVAADVPKTRSQAAPAGVHAATATDLH